MFYASDYFQKLYEYAVHLTKDGKAKGLYAAGLVVGKTAYVACAASDYVSVVDLMAKREVAKINVGQVPKRNITAILP